METLARNDLNSDVLVDTNVTASLVCSIQPKVFGFFQGV